MKFVFLETPCFNIGRKPTEVVLSLRLIVTLDIDGDAARLGRLTTLNKRTSLRPLIHSFIKLTIGLSCGFVTDNFLTT